MNSLIEQHYPILKQALILRHEMLASLADGDLLFSLPNNMTLGELCCQQGAIDQSYIEAFKTFNQNWDYHYPNTSVETNLSELRTWYNQLEEELEATISHLTEEQVQTQIINRGSEFNFPISIVFHIYRESLLIFYAKASIYLRALNKPLSDQWLTWIG